MEKDKLYRSRSATMKGRNSTLSPTMKRCWDLQEKKSLGSEEGRRNDSGKMGRQGRGGGGGK